MLSFSSCAKKTENVNASTRVVIDHDGEEVTIPSKVEKAVVAGVWPLPSVITVFLGSSEKLIGIPPASLGAAKAGLLGELFPEYLNIDSHFMTSDTVNVEEILKLNPDVVFTGASQPKTKEELKKAGIPAIAVSVNKWDYNILETYDGWIDILSQVWPENDKTDKVSEYSKKVYNTIQERVSKIKEEDRKKVLFLFTCNDKTIVTSGKHFFGQFWCEAVGAKNVAEEIGAENSNAVINMEQIYKWNPDIILITNFTSQVPEDLYNNKTANYDWSPLKAIQNKNVYKMPLGTYRSYTPSADTPVTLYWIAKKVYPELFADINVEKEVKDYFKNMYGIDLTEEQIERMYNQDAKGAAGTRGN